MSLIQTLSEGIVVTLVNAFYCKTKVPFLQSFGGF